MRRVIVAVEVEDVRSGSFPDKSTGELVQWARADLYSPEARERYEVKAESGQVGEFIQTVRPGERILAKLGVSSGQSSQADPVFKFLGVVPGAAAPKS